MKNMNYDVAIIGGGASGLMTAVEILSHNKKCSVAIIEHHKRVGRKLMATGNGRCNLTNENISTNAYYGSLVRYADTIFNRYNSDYIKGIFSKIGLVTYSDNEGRVYPLSNNVSSVLDCLRNYILNNNAFEICETDVNKIVPKKNGYQLICKQGDENISINARFVVLACGGKASPKLSTDGSGYNLTQQLGIKNTTIFPSLTSLKCNEKYLSSLKGLRVKGEISLLADGKIIDTQNGEIQFTENSLSGICVFQLSRYVNEYFFCGTVNNKRYKKLAFEINIMPNLTEQMCQQLIYERANLLRDYTIDKFLDGFLHKKLGLQLLKQCGIVDLNKKVNSLTKQEKDKISYMLNHWRFIPKEKSNFENAQVTAGGICADEINPFSMESRKYKGLYIIGELLDIDGMCGGYNLHWAWCSGIISAENIIKRLGEK